jgi:hypothetical protein
MSDAFDEAHRSPRRSTARCQITDNRKVTDPTPWARCPRLTPERIRHASELVGSGRI